MHIARDEHSVHTDQPGPGAVENAADRGVAKLETVGSGARARLDAAFARQEQRGLMLAAAARSVAVCVIICWYVVANTLDRWLVASAELVQAVEREAAETTLLSGLEPAGSHALRGRDAPIEVWVR